MKQNTEKNTFKREGKTGRFWLSGYHMVEAKISEAIKNSQIKRGESEPLAGKWKHHAWGCGCCVNLLEYPKEDNSICTHYSNRKFRRDTFYEVGGKRIRRIELTNGSVLEV
jgi:hypothetical protein